MILLIITSCNRDRASGDIFSQNNYVRISSASDSVAKMYVLYKSKIDPNRIMYKFYWDNGKLQGISFFLNGVKDGPWLRYFDNGSISFEGTYLQGKKNGIHKLYFPNRRISTVENYQMDKKIGVWYYYDTSGSLLNTESY
jgi:antitoxin component YwqK of YwqJK toxin-antitoxin module